MADGRVLNPDGIYKELAQKMLEELIEWLEGEEITIEAKGIRLKVKIERR